MSIVQVPGTFFESNNRDETTLFDDLTKMMFHLLKKHQRMLHKIVLFIPHSAFPITSQSIIGTMSPVIYSDYGMSDLRACVDVLAITNRPM